MIARRVRVRGRVQGVGFRDAMVDAAQFSGVRGWVRNRRDGSVEAVVQGPPAAVQALIDWAHQGPPRAQVNAVQVGAVPAQAITGFERRDTA